MMSAEVHMFGIKNCDTVRKAIRWLAEREIDSQFYDLKTEELADELIIEWLDHVGEDKLINRRGLTWRKIDAEDKILNNQEAYISLVKKYPTVVKRPVVFNGKFWSVGFKPDEWNDMFL
ncbi:MAG: arsenate reductase [Gammaproteobacteria bacterium]|nr:MAG: arsenate reductase [Gammaproteobacteria bacterium]